MQEEERDKKVSMRKANVTAAGLSKKEVSCALAVGCSVSHHIWF